MRTAWRDPDDINPNRRLAREITGFRSYDPLRRCRQRPGTSVTERHVVAADILSIGTQKGPRIGVQKGPRGSGLCR